MQTAARLDFIGLPRLRGCGGSVFLCWKENWGAVDCVGKVGLCARRYRNCVKRRCGLILSGCHGCGGAADSFFLLERENFGGGFDLCRRGLFCARLWIVSARVGFGARLWFVGARVGFGRGVDCVGEVGLGARLWFVGGEVGLGAWKKGKF